MGSVARSTDRRQQTKDRVLDTALRLFNERGYLGVRVEDIAQQAGVSRATFYKHFAEREQILAELRAAARIRTCAHRVPRSARLGNRRAAGWGGR